MRRLTGGAGAFLGGGCAGGGLTVTASEKTSGQSGSSGSGLKGTLASLLASLLGIGGDVTRMTLQTAAEAGDAAGEDVATRIAEEEAQVGIKAKAFQPMAAEEGETDEFTNDFTDGIANATRTVKAFLGQAPDDTSPIIPSPVRRHKLLPVLSAARTHR